MLTRVGLSASIASEKIRFEIVRSFAFYRSRGIFMVKYFITADQIYSKIVSGHVERIRIDRA
jgi:hypothetical protein